MANLVSPGVSVTITDESFFIPAAATTVPLFFIATAESKKQPDGVTDAAGTQEYNVVRTVTSLQQSFELYGVPRFLEASDGTPHHGDSRNEYGLLALNQFLGLGNRAFVVRANVNLNDDLNDIRTAWQNEILDASFTLEGLASAFIDEYNTRNGYVQSNPNFKTTVTTSEVISLAHQATVDVWDRFSFSNLEEPFFDDNNLPTLATSGEQTYSFDGALDKGVYMVTFATPVSGLTATGLTNDATVYAMTVTVDGVPLAVAVQGQDAQTYDALVAQINSQLGSAATAVISNGRIDIWSETTGVLSTVDVLDSNLLGNLVPAWTLPSDVVAGGASGDHATWLTGATTYTMTVTVDGIPESIQVLGSAAQTFGTDGLVAGTLLYEIKQDLGTRADVALVDGNVVVTSATTGLSSTVLTVDGVTNGLIAALSASLLTPVNGKDGDALMDVFENGFALPATTTFEGFEGMAANCVTLGFCPTVANEFTPAEARDLLEAAADLFQYTVEFKDFTKLGENDAARRVAIVNALQAAVNGNLLVRADQMEYNLILCPGYPEVADELLNLSVDIKEEALVIADTPMNLSPDDVVSWADTNSQRQHGTTVCYYYPHGLMSNIDGKTVLGAASGIALRTITYSDSVSEVWYAPAGTRRGLVSGVVTVGYVSGTLGGPTTFNEAPLSEGQRDNLYKYFTNVNPITYLPGRGLMVFGQKTSAPNASARDRINVERMLMYIRRQLRKNGIAFLFEPNDGLTRANLKAMVDGFLNDIMVKRGLYDYATVCDESNNTPDRVDRNELYIDVALKPTKAAEFLYIPIRVVATGAEI